jgi:hypothetical protein
LILTSHGSRTGLAVKAGRLTQTLTPSNLTEMLSRTAMRYKVVVISACYRGSSFLVSLALIRWSSLLPMPTIRPSAVGKKPSGPISALLRSGELRA